MPTFLYESKNLRVFLFRLGQWLGYQAEGLPVSQIGHEAFRHIPPENDGHDSIRLGIAVEQQSATFPIPIFQGKSLFQRLCLTAWMIVRNE